MTAYTALKPVTRVASSSRTWAPTTCRCVQFAFGLVVGFIMQGYCRHRRAGCRGGGRCPIDARRPGRPCWSVFWVWFQSGSQWASTGFYFFGLILGILVISQFWTLANEVYDPRQAKRIFGFIGGGASLGGIAGSSLHAAGHGRSARTNLLLVSAAPDRRSA